MTTRHPLPDDLSIPTPEPGEVGSERALPFRGLLEREDVAGADFAHLATLLAAERGARAEAELILSIATAAAGEDDLDRILEETLRRLDGVLTFTGGSITLIEGDDLVLRAAVGPFKDTALGQRLRRGRGLSWRVIESGEPHLVADLLETPNRPLGAYGPGTIRSYLAAPLIALGRPVGLIEVDSTTPDAFRGRDRDLMRQVARALSGPVELARRHAAETEALAASAAAQRRLYLLSEASRVLASGVGYESMLGELSGLLVPAVADVCVISLGEARGPQRVTAVAHGEPAVEAQLRPLLGRPWLEDGPGGATNPVASALRNAQALLYEQVRESLLGMLIRGEEMLGRLRGLDLGHLVIVPLIARGRLIGSLSLGTVGSGRTFARSDLTMAEELARRIASAADRSQLYAAEQAARRAAEETAQRMARLQAVTAALSETLSIDAMARVVLDQGMTSLHATGGCLYVVSERPGELELLHAVGYDEAALEAYRRIGSDADVPLAEAFRSRRTVYVSSPEEWASRYPAIPYRQGASASWLAVPLATEGQTLGVLGFSFPVARGFPPAERAFIQSLSLQCAQALERARLYESQREGQVRSTFRAQASQLLAASDDWEQGLRELVRLIVPLIADCCIADVVHAGGGLRRIAVASGAGPEAERLARRLLLPRETSTADSRGGPLVEAIEHGRARWIPALAPEVLDPLDPENRQALEQLDARALAVVPLVLRGATLGALTFIWCTPTQHRGTRDLAFLEDLAARTAVAIDRARLNRQLRQFKTTLDTTLDSVYMFDPQDLRFFYVNEGAVAASGYRRPELLRAHPYDLLPEYDETRFRALLAPLLQPDAGNTQRLTTLQRRRDGADFPVELFMQYVEPRGEPGRAIAIVRDITDRVEARARLQRLAQSERALNAELRTIIQSMEDAALVFSDSGEIIFANRAAEQLLQGASSVGHYDEVMGHLFADLSEAPLLGHRERQGPIVASATGQTERWLELTALPIFTALEGREGGPDPEPVETILFVRDVTEERRMQTARDAFIGVLSHELRTPVTTIYGNSKLLSRTGSRMDANLRREVFADIESEAERLYRLVEDLLVLARYGEAQRGQLGNDPLLLQRIVPIVVRSEQVRWPDTRYLVEIPPNLPAVEGDQTYVEQVVRNLLSNAAKYGGEGEAVDVVLEERDGGVAVMVRDAGPGFSEEEGPRLFELFYRSPSAKLTAGGAGIGLFVCRRLVEAMGGRIWATPRAAGGAEFGFSLHSFDEEA